MHLTSVFMVGLFFGGLDNQLFDQKHLTDRRHRENCRAQTSNPALHEGRWWTTETGHTQS